MTLPPLRTRLLLERLLGHNAMVTRLTKHANLGGDIQHVRKLECIKGKQKSLRKSSTDVHSM